MSNKISAWPISRVCMLFRKTIEKVCGEQSKSKRFLKVGRAIFNISSISRSVNSNEKKHRRLEKEKTGINRIRWILYNSNSGLIRNPVGNEKHCYASSSIPSFRWFSLSQLVNAYLLKHRTLKNPSNSSMCRGSYRGSIRTRIGRKKTKQCLSGTSLDSKKPQNRVN